HVLADQKLKSHERSRRARIRFPGGADARETTYRVRSDTRRRWKVCRQEGGERGGHGSAPNAVRFEFRGEGKRQSLPKTRDEARREADPAESDRKEEFLPYV